MRNRIVRTIKELAEKDKNIVLMSGDLGYGVLDDFIKEMPEQYFNAGICEQNMSSMAAGLAMEGKVVYTYSIGNFPTLRCLEQIRNDICYHNVKVRIVAVGGGFAYGSLGMSHHATEDIAIMRSLPNMMVFTPADAVEAEMIARKTVYMDSPCYIRLNKGGEPKIHDSIDEIENWEIGQAIQLLEGQDTCLFAVGAIVDEALRVAELLKKEGIYAAVYSFPCVKPIDKTLIQWCGKQYKTIYTIEEHNIIGGFGSAVSEVITEQGFSTKIVRIGLQDVYSSIVGSQEYLRSVYGMDRNAIIKRVKMGE